MPTDTAREVESLGAPRLEGGGVVVAALEARGVGRIFSVSGGPINSIYHATSLSSIQLCHVRHEAAGAYMADAAYRATGQPGVMLATLGPGVTNTVTAVGTAQRAGVPMLVIGGQASTAQLGRGAGMELATVEVMRPVTKWAAGVMRTERIGEYMDEAWRRMLAPTPGPVYLEIPVDVLSAATNAPLAFAALPAPGLPTADPAAMQRAREVFLGAHRPLVLAGDDVFHTRSEAALRRLVDSRGFPFALLRLARGAVDETHEFCIGPGYVPANPVLRRALAETDAVLLMGHHWEFDLDFGAGVNPDAAVVQVQLDPGMIGRNGHTSLGIVAAVKTVADALSTPGPQECDLEWAKDLAAKWRAHRSGLASRARDSRGLHPVTVAEEIASALPPEGILVTSHGNVDFWADVQVQVRRPGCYLRAGQSGALGAEIPYGVAAKLAFPNRPVVVLVGDGGVGYHVMELETAARYGANVVVVVADDEKWGAIALPQKRAYGIEVEMGLPRRDWAAVVRALGGHGETVTNPAEVGPALKRALAAGRPSIVHAHVISEESPYMSYISG